MLDRKSTQSCSPETRTKYSINILINKNGKTRLWNIPVNIYFLTIIYIKLIKMYKAHYYRNNKFLEYNNIFN